MGTVKAGPLTRHVGKVTDVAVPFRLQLGVTAYDVKAAAKRLRASEWPGTQEWIGEYLRGSYSDAEALAAFTPLVEEGPRGAG